MGYCDVGEKAFVTYTTESGERIRREFAGSPIDVSIAPTSPGSFRFYGVGDDGLSYELFATGYEPSYVLNTSFNGRGYTPVMDGVVLRSSSYYYVSGYGIDVIVPPTAKHRIHITGTGVDFYDYVAGDDGNYKVSCGDGCPEGFCKCPSPEYPGYCCLDCSAIAGSIHAITNELRGRNG